MGDETQIGTPVQWPLSTAGSSQRMSEQIENLVAAFSKAQAEFPAVLKTAKNPYLGSKYADISSIKDSVRPVLSRHGLAVFQRPLPTDGSTVRIETILAHVSGQWIGGELTLKPAKADPQSFGSAITYASRYSLQALLFLSTDDDDGQASSQTPSPAPTSQPAPPPWSPTPPAQPAALEPPDPTWVNKPCHPSDQNRIKELLAKLQIDPERARAFLATQGVQTLAQLSIGSARDLIRELERRELEQEAKQAF